MGKIKKMIQEIREADASKRNGDAAAMTEAARAAMEEDIRETLAAKDPHFDEEDVKREDEDNVQLGDEIRYEIEWKDLWG